MKAFALVLLAAAHVSGDAYTIGQVHHGAGFGGVITGVDYGHGVVSGLGAIGNRAYFHHYGKREAEAKPYTPYQVAAGLPVHNAYATGHPHNVGVVTGISYGHHFYGKREAEAEPGLLYRGYGLGHGYGLGYAGHLGYGGYGLGYGHHYYGKREAEPYTIGQVAAGLPVAHAIASGRAHNVGVITGVSHGYGYGLGLGHHFYGKREAEAEPGYLGHYGYGGYGLGYAGHIGYGGYGLGYGYGGHYYGKREAEAEPGYAYGGYGLGYAGLGYAGHIGYGGYGLGYGRGYYYG